MKFGKEESIQKLDQCWAPFQILLLVTQDLWQRISTRKNVTVILAHGSSPSWRALQVARMRQAGNVVHGIAGDRENECWISLSHPAFCVWSVLSWQWLLINQAKNVYVLFLFNFPGTPRTSSLTWASPASPQGSRSCSWRCSGQRRLIRRYIWGKKSF